MPKKVIGFRVTEQEEKKLRELCKASGRNVSSVLRVLVRLAEPAPGAGLCLRADQSLVKELRQ